VLTSSKSRSSSADPQGLRVLITTEGTYPFVVGGVSTWCHQLLKGTPDITWDILPITAGGLRKSSRFVVPPNATLLPAIDLWSRHSMRRRPHSRALAGSVRPTLAAELAAALMGWDVEPDSCVPLFLWCQQFPWQVVMSFKHPRSWPFFLDALEELLAERHPDVGPLPVFDVHTAVELYRTLSWVARAAGTEVPESDVIHVTAAGWAAIPAIIGKKTTGVPMLLSEHGIYVRESYLGAVRSDESPAAKMVNTRLARALTRACYAVADVVAPVADAHRAWETSLGVPATRIQTIPNGVATPGAFAPAPRTKTVISVGRIDPLKDVHTLLHVAAAVSRNVPDVTFLHYGPVSEGQDRYAESCYRLHKSLRLEGSFRFMGVTNDATGVMRDADVVLMTSISEGFPMTILESLSQGRPVVTTMVGGVLDAMLGAGITAPPGDVNGLAAAVITLVNDPDLAATLGARGHRRVGRLFSTEKFLRSYRELLYGLAGKPMADAA
jgi:glycosyltransferase involved in cell wall biosynthesis